VFFLPRLFSSFSHPSSYQPLFKRCELWSILSHTLRSGPSRDRLCGIQICHPFYFVDAALPPIVGYDLMRAAHLVVDVDNHLVWSRRLRARFPLAPILQFRFQIHTSTPVLASSNPSHLCPFQLSPTPVCLLLRHPFKLERPVRWNPFILCPVWSVTRCPSSFLL